MNYIGSADDIIIAGDLNYDMQLSSTPLHGFCGTFGLTNVIEKPTRLNPITLTMTLLDVILKLSLKFFICSEVFKFPMSDHSLCISIFNHSSVKFKPKAFVSRFISKEKLEELRKLFNNYPWHIFNILNDPEVRWNSIKTTIIMMLNQVAPLKTIILKEKKIPWYNSSLVSLSKKRSMAYNRARSTGKPEDWLKFKQLRNRYQKCYKSSKQAFYKESTDVRTNDPTKLWRSVRTKLNPNSNSQINSLCVNGTIIAFLT